MIRADLHLHTLYSDGDYSPEEIASRVKNAGVSLFSITDHDSLEGVEDARAAAEHTGLTYVPGWEVSSYRNDAKVHVLGYCCNRNDAYSTFLKARIEGARARAEDSLNKANAYFSLHLTYADVERLHVVKSAPVHTMHVVTAFSQRLHVKRGALYREAFSYGKPAYSGLYRPTPEEAIEIIHATGGIAVLAHPGHIAMEKEEKERLIADLVARGLDGIECFHSTHTEEATAYFQALASSYQLYITGGSDFHSDKGRRVIGKPAFYADERLLRAFSL